ncbi:MAG: U32 family peptidase [Bacilli bacterium]|nr:U32 family peptidase [Bacilli bacterium]MBR3209805.1 U32 family peptidase [Bacilli bacterium]
MEKPELLSPAGDLERLKIALMYGADAVYIGGHFNLRANTPNFTLKELEEGIKYAHKLNKKVYVTVNIAMHNKELEKIEEYLKELKKINVDAIIVSDPGVIALARPLGLNIHLSTQASTLNYKAVKFWEKEGVQRIVLARECTKDDIKKIKEETNIEIETFIHGAMCASFSGRCVLSNYLTNRDSNRGGCSQICRWDFDLYDEKNNITGEKPFTFCTKDLSLAKYIPELIELNVDSFKIEGRMRSIYYIATVVKTYRKIIDEYFEDKENYKYNEEYQKTLDEVANRDSIDQFFNGRYGKEVQYYNGRQEMTNQDFIGLILEYDGKTKLAKIEERNHFEKGDKIEIFGPKESIKMTIEDIFDENMNKIDVVRHPKQIVYIKIEEEVKKDYMIKCIDKHKNV